MSRGTGFWFAMIAFQILFGLGVFAVTKHYYSGQNVAPTRQPVAVLPEGLTAADIARLSSGTPAVRPLQDPAEISRQADEFFFNRQYGQAAELYERLLELNPRDAGVLNNLGLTLHYLGRSTEGLAALGEGVALEPSNQRLWLTLGFINAQLGNTGDARTALTRATEIGTDESIRQSAQTMLQELP